MYNNLKTIFSALLEFYLIILFRYFCHPCRWHGMCSEMNAICNRFTFIWIIFSFDVVYVNDDDVDDDHDACC